MKEYTEKEIEDMKIEINTLTQKEMANLWRYAPAGHPYFRNDLPLYEHFRARFRGFTSEISKEIDRDREGGR
jgi:hypothetical protein